MSPAFGPSVNVPKVGSIAFTVSVVLTLALRYVPSLAWVAVIVLVPAPTIVTVLVEMVATFVLLDVYVNAPKLFEDGSTTLNDTSVPTVFVGMTARAPIVGAGSVDTIAPLDIIYSADRTGVPVIPDDVIPVKFAPVKFVDESTVTFTSVAFVKLQFVKLDPVNVVDVKLTPVKFTPEKSVDVKSP
jgi:hypothetical protein